MLGKLFPTSMSAPPIALHAQKSPLNVDEPAPIARVPAISSRSVTRTRSDCPNASNFQRIAHQLHRTRNQSEGSYTFSDPLSNIIGECLDISVPPTSSDASPITSVLRPKISAHTEITSAFHVQSPSLLHILKK